MSTEDNINLQTQAVWYAWGQQDAGIGRNVDAMAFAQHFRRLDEEGSRPSIQDAWRTYISGPPVAAIADEVRDFLAKAVDEAQP